MLLDDLIIIIVSILALIISVAGFFISCLNYKHDQFEYINSFFEHMLDHDFVEARKFVYNMELNKCIKLDSSDKEQYNVAMITNTYHHWGLLLIHKQLPLWIFYDKKNGLTSSGIAVIRLYNKLRPTIEYRRNNGNLEYAKFFEKLYDRLVSLSPKYKDYTG